MAKDALFYLPGPQVIPILTKTQIDLEHHFIILSVLTSFSDDNHYSFQVVRY